MTIFNIEDAFEISNSTCSSFYYEKEPIFELHKGKPTNDKNSTMLFYETQLEAILSFNVLKNKYKAAVVWSESHNEWIVIINLNYEEYSKQ
ncbi:MAG: hypothetical protein Unbinned2350contig1001_25 [Prokaryotic dsDNA virus sp.]|nr:MAG: hypothetical protein Unbinned2350contig1001_25 [Prokaryotic dsDNA virus sp.]|tara:strand:+ start:22959 stop:23231 length:273 start_codon:yes stop_codon:yes gene_type:complete